MVRTSVARAFALILIVIGSSRLTAAGDPTFPAYETARLSASASNDWDRFGSAVALSGDGTAVAGSPWTDLGPHSNAGATFVYVHDGVDWREQAVLITSDFALDERFGSSVAISGGSILVGAPQDDAPFEDNAGAAYVFVRDGECGSSWCEQAKLTAEEPTAQDAFGASAALSGDTAIVGAPQLFGDDGGSAYVFVRDGAVWSLQARLTASDGRNGDRLGGSVAVSGDTAVAGAARQDEAANLAGAAYVFVRDGSRWTEQAKLIASDASTLDYFGGSVAISGDTIVVGAVGAEAAYVFRRTGSAWVEQAKLGASDGLGNDEFGSAVAISGDAVVVGARWQDSSGVFNAGAAYVFTGNGFQWTEQAKLRASDPGDSDLLGSAVAIVGDTALAGAPSDDHEGGIFAGSVYVFEGSAAPGEVFPDLLLDRLSPTALALFWSGSSCTGPTHYAVYQGGLGDWYSHSPLKCEISSDESTATVTVPEEDAYFLVTAHNEDGEGSYGRASSRNERPPALAPCAPAPLLGCP